jgi:hypothetical protein
MNFTIEQLDAVIAMAEAAKAKLEPPKVVWMVLDKDGDQLDRPQDSEQAGRAMLSRGQAEGSYKPYTLYRCEEVK